MPTRDTRLNTYEKTRLRRSTRPKIRSWPRKRITPCVPGFIRTQIARAAAGSAIITLRLAVPLRNGSNHAPAINTRPGWIQLPVIVVFRSHQPQLSEQLGHDDDRNARGEAVERAPRRQILEPEVSVVGAQQARRGDLDERDGAEPEIEPPFHGSTLPASLRTGFGYRPSARLAIAVNMSGTTIHRTSATGCASSAGASKYALYKMGPRYPALSSELARSTPNDHRLPRSIAPVARYHFDTNPDAGGMPTRLSDAIANAAIVQGICRAMPDIWLTSVLCVDT